MGSRQSPSLLPGQPRLGGRKYEDPQPRLYWVDAVDVSNSKLETDASDKRQAQRWFADYPGEVVSYTSLPDGSVLCGCRQRNRSRVRLASESPKLPSSSAKDGTEPTSVPTPRKNKAQAKIKARASPSPTRQRSGPRGLPGRRSRQTGASASITAFNSSSPSAISPSQALSLDLRRRHVRRRLADVSARKIRSEESAHVRLHSRWPARRRRRPLEADWYQWIASRHRRDGSSSSPNISRIDRLRRQVRAPESSLKWFRVPARYD